MFILDANAYARNPGGAAEGIAKMINNVGGELLASRLWNEQKLAFPIKGRYKGAYWLTYCRIEGAKLSEFNRACQLNDIILRHLIVKIDERLIDPLVAAANGRGTTGAKAEVSEKSENSEGVDSTDKGKKPAKSQPATAAADA
jgi:small subunit ribosomal protein S6